MNSRFNFNSLAQQIEYTSIGQLILPTTAHEEPHILVDSFTIFNKLSFTHLVSLYIVTDNIFKGFFVQLFHVVFFAAKVLLLRHMTVVDFTTFAVLCGKFHHTRCSPPLISKLQAFAPFSKLSSAACLQTLHFIPYIQKESPQQQLLFAQSKIFHYLCTVFL